MRTRAHRLVGRGADLDLLDQALTAGRAGRGSAVFLLGEPGIGKSRLAAEAVGRALAERMVVLRGRASTVGPTVPFRPLAEALLSSLRTGVVFPEDQLGPYRSVLGRLVPEWAGGNGQHHSESLVALAEAVLRLTAVLGTERGCLLVLDDLHDADVETLAIVEYLCDNLANQPTVLLATLRSEPGVALDIVRSTSLRMSGVAVELDRLGREDVRELIASCLDTTADQVTDAVAQELWSVGAGNPFVVEELLYGMVTCGRLLRGSDGWRVVDEVRTDVPVTLVRSIAARTGRLGAQGRQLLAVAAVLGNSFPVSVVQRVSGVDDHVLLSHLRAAVAAHLIVPDERGPDWYAFQHPLTAEALLAELAPLDRVRISLLAAQACEQAYPGLPGEWCQLAARLRLGGEDAVGAARLLAEAGRRAFADGAAGSAVTLLDQAEQILDAQGDTMARAEVLETLLYALAESGQFERARELVEAINSGSPGLDARRRISLHVRLAWAAYLAGRAADGMVHVHAARAVLPSATTSNSTAAIDAVNAYLALDGPGADRLREAESLARRVVDNSEAVDDPLVTCQAWHALGQVARQRDLAEAAAYFDRARHIAEQHQLPIWRVYALIGAAGSDWLAEADVDVLASARMDALSVGAVSLAHNVDAIMALDAVLRGEFPRATQLIEESMAVVDRLQLHGVRRYLLMARGTLAAHQGRRREMDEALDELRRSGGEQSREWPLALGLARAFCALLEEDGPGARRELALVSNSLQASPTTFYLSGTAGLGLLLAALDGSADLAVVAAAAATTPGGMRWNRQFVGLAEAVLLGRAGRQRDATDAAERATAAAAPFVTSAHLAKRLVAMDAHRDGWGDPVGWLREAEEHFHGQGVLLVSGACRALLRRIGEPVRQRRVDVERVPVELRVLGVTVREYEVFELLVHHLGNRAIAERLHISHRTVEKHMAQLMLKTSASDREALVGVARRLAS